METARVSGDMGYRQSEQLAFAAVAERFRAFEGAFDVVLKNPHVLAQEAQGLLAWGQWAVSGKLIVEVSPLLTEALSHSDLGDMVLSDVFDLKAPACFYVHFGKSCGIRFEEDTVAMEGAYVYAHPESLRVVLCGRLPDGTPVLDTWRERYDLRVPSTLYGLPADEAIDKALALDLADLKSVAEKTGNALFLEKLAQRQQCNHPAWGKALRLVLNLMAWKKAYPSDSEERWPDEAPTSLVSQASQPSRKQQDRARSKLWSIGWLPVTRLGIGFSRRFEETFNGSHASPVRHWRNGHWRNQAHGPSFSLRKLIWIWPTLVGRVEG